MLPPVRESVAIVSGTTSGTTSAKPMLPPVRESVAVATAVTDAELTQARRARAQRLLLEAELRLHNGTERDEEPIVLLAASLLSEILGDAPTIICYTFDTATTVDSQQELRLRWRYGYEPREPGPGLHVAMVPLFLDGDIAAHTARARAPRTWQRVAGEGQHALGGEPDEDVRGGAEARARFSILSVPILIGEVLLGVLNAYRPAVLPFDAEQLAMMTTFARGVAVALLNARLAARLTEASARARDLVDHSPDTILVHTAEGRIVEANTAANELLGLPAGQLAGTHLLDYLSPEMQAPLEAHLATSLDTADLAASVELGYSRLDGTVGTLQVRTRRLQEQDAEGVPLLQSIGRDVTAERHQRSALETKVRELDLLIGVGENLNSSLQLEAVLRKTLQSLTSVVACPTATIHLYDEARQLLLPVGEQGWPIDEEPLRAIRVGEGPIGAAVRVGRIAFVADLNRLTGTVPMRLPRSPRAMLVVPFMRGTAPLGCFTLLRPLDARFTADERRLAAAVARQTAIAIENARLFERVQRQLQQIKDFQGLTADLVTDLDLDPTLERICQTLASLLGAEKTAVRFLDEAGTALTLVAHHGLSERLLQVLRRSLATDGEADEALHTRDCVVTPDLRLAAPDPLRGVLLSEGLIASCTVPIVGKGRLPLGVLHAAWSVPHRPSAEEIELVRAYANYAAAAIENARLYNRTRELYLAGVQSLAATVDARDAYTHRHSRNVAFYAREMARELGLSQGQIEAVELAALLHDIGKIGISDAILGKPGKLSASEMSVMISHARQGADILSVNGALAGLVPLVLHHHEWHNGSGYPDGLAGEAIPLGAAIISAADAFDTMTTDRSYRRARTFEAARQELTRSAGRQFHPGVIEAFTRVLERDDALDAPYLRPLRERGTANFTSALLTLAEAEQRELPPVEAGTGQIRPQQIKELNALHHLARSLSAITDLDRFLDSAVSLITHELGYADCAILLHEEETRELVVRAFSGFERSMRGQRLADDAGLLGWALAQGQGQNIARIASDARYTAWLPTSRSALLAPLCDAGRAIGVVVIEGAREAAFTPDDEMALETIANQLAIGIAVARLHDREKRAAITDGLTGAYNHRYFYQRLEQEIAGAEAQGYPLAVLVLDLNGLKALNDTHGHLAGDAALRTVAGLLRDCTRENDTVARYGGDEFAVILPGALEEDAARLLARLRARLLETRSLGGGAQLAPLVVSAGMAAYPSEGTRAAALVAIADERMYRQKRTGKRTIPPPPSDDRASARRRIVDRLGEAR